MQIQPINRNKFIMEMQTIKLSKPLKVSIISLFILLVLYFGMSTYFSTHFYFGSVINGINASGKTVEQLNKSILLKGEVIYIGT